MASSGFKIKVGLDSTAAERGLSRIGRNAGRLNKRMGRLAGTGLKFGASIAAATTAMAAFAGIKFIKDSSQAAADFEKMGAGFEILLGSAEKAQKRLEALQKMSMATPFEPKELIAASKMLQAMGGETLAVGEGLEMIGDAAAISGRSLEEVARHTGRIMAGLTPGQSVMEPLRQLQEMGAIGKEGFEALEKLNTEMVSGSRAAMTNADAYKELSSAFSATAGGMERLSETTSGKVSTMRGHLDMLRIAFGTGVNEGLVKGLDAMNEQLPKWMEKSKALGDAIGVGISEAIKGNTELLELQIAFLMQKLAAIAGAVFVQALGGVFRSLIPTMIEKLFSVPGVEQLMAVTQPGVWAALKGLQSNKDMPRVPLSDLISSAEDVVGVGETKVKLDEMLGELKRIAEAAEKNPDKSKKNNAEAEITSSVFGGVTYHHGTGPAWP